MYRNKNTPASGKVTFPFSIIEDLRKGTCFRFMPTIVMPYLILEIEAGLDSKKGVIITS